MGGQSGGWSGPSSSWPSKAFAVGGGEGPSSYLERLGTYLLPLPPSLPVRV